MKLPNGNDKTDRKGERGAALVMALLVSFLLLVASAGLLLETSMNAGNVTDATAEQQAYNAAESGINSAVNVLRGNVIPNPLIDTSKPVTDPANKIDFIKALKLATSNTDADTGTTPRLSRWMTYNAGFPDRVGIGSGTYAPNSGFAYSLAISDPDNTGAIVTYSAVGRLFEADPTDNTQKTYGSGGDTVRIRYIGKSETTIDTTSGAAPVDFGGFEVAINGAGAEIPAFNRFEIVVRMTRPYSATRVIRGFIETNSVPYTTPPKIIFDSQTFTLQGSVINLDFAWGSPVFQNIIGPPQRVGYEANLSSGNNVVTGTMSSPEPIRLLIKSTGYGPRGARKQLEAVIQKNFFNGLSAPATLTLVGPRTTSSPATTFLFDPGSSNVATYTGDDVASTDIIPPIGTTSSTNLQTVEASVDGQPPHPFNGDVIGTPTDVSIETPEWLQNPEKLDTAIKALYAVANSSGRYFPSGVLPTGTNPYGDHDAAQGITFLDGNAEFTGEGGGILVVTGTLTLKGDFSFRGLIVVTGRGGVQRQGAGNGSIEGNMVIAPYVNSGVLPSSEPVGTSFLAPQYDLSGGGNSTIAYNSSTIGNGLVAVSNFVLGVVEK